MKDGSTAGRYLGLLLGSLLGVFALLWVYTAQYRANFLPETYGAWRAVMGMARTCDTGEVTVMGASQASVAVMPRLLNLPASAKNYALTASTPVEAYYLARQVYRCPSPPKVVVLMYSGYDFAGSEYFWEHAVRFGLLDFEELQEVARVAAEVGNTQLYQGSFGSEPPPTLKNLLYATHFPPYDFASLLAAKGGNRRQENDRLTAETLASGGQHLLDNKSCVDTHGWEAEHATFTPSRLIMVYLERLIEMLHAHGAHIAFISPPMTNLTYRDLPERYARDYERFVDGIRAEHPDIMFAGPLFPRMDRCFFTDTFHVNARGAEAFSRTLGPLIAETLAAWDEKETATTD